MQPSARVDDLGDLAVELAPAAAIARAAGPKWPPAASAIAAAAVVAARL